ncbi:unnamed protein product [Blepharisma stoltei]|uniref:Uncharacterized protein n=1 Tax=Blepharisma stoltei TaxID=1481888 RepID=A0AAU9JHD9_9CILI|nr:unnamed protein product [Blepharisma stoltei]
MDIIKCFISECILKPQGFCDCLGYPVLFCETHCYNHLQNIKERPHELQDLWHLPYESTRKVIIDEANQLKRSIKDSRKYLISEFNKILHLLVGYKNLSFSILNNLEKKANEFIKAASYIKEVPTYPKVKDYQLLLRLKLIEAKYRARTWRISSDWIKTKKILLSIKKSFELFRINPFKEICHLYTYSDSIFYFYGYSKELKEFNFISKQRKVYNLDLRENIWNNISVCPLPNDRIFCYGNRANNSITGLTFIIEKDKTISMLPEGKASCDSGSILYNNHIYSFGGVLGVSVKFCLNKNTWKSCCQLPKGNYK